MCEVSISPKAARFDKDVMWVELANSRTIGVPFTSFLCFLHAGLVEREARNFTLRNPHREALNEDVSVAGLRAGQGARTGRHAQKV